LFGRRSVDRVGSFRWLLPLFIVQAAIGGWIIASDEEPGGTLLRGRVRRWRSW
jgi:hypothetical protein